MLKTTLQTTKIPLPIQFQRTANIISANSGRISVESKGFTIEVSAIGYTTVNKILTN